MFYLSLELYFNIQLLHVYSAALLYALFDEWKLAIPLSAACNASIIPSDEDEFLCSGAMMVRCAGDEGRLRI